MLTVRYFLQYEPPHDKTNKMTVRPAKTQISLGIRTMAKKETVNSIHEQRNKNNIVFVSKTRDIDCKFLNNLWDVWFSVLNCIKIHVWENTQNNWAATWQNQQSKCTPSEDSDQPGHPPSLIRVFAVRSMGSLGPKFSSCGQRRLWTDCALSGSVGS